MNPLASWMLWQWHQLGLTGPHQQGITAAMQAQMAARWGNLPTAAVLSAFREARQALTASRAAARLGPNASVEPLFRGRDVTPHLEALIRVTYHDPVTGAVSVRQHTVDVSEAQTGGELHALLDDAAVDLAEAYDQVVGSVAILGVY